MGILHQTPDIPILTPIRLQPRASVLSIADAAEREAALNGIELVDRLIERFGADRVHSWLWMNAAARGQSIPCLKGER